MDSSKWRPQILKVLFLNKTNYSFVTWFCNDSWPVQRMWQSWNAPLALCIVHPSRPDKSPSLVILGPDFTGLLKDTVHLGRKWIPEKAVAGKKKTTTEVLASVSNHCLLVILSGMRQDGHTNYLPLRIPSNKDSIVLNILKYSQEMQYMQYMDLRFSWFLYSMIVLCM